MLYAVLDAVVHFGALGIVEAIDCTDQVAGDAADAFETDAFAILAHFFFRHCVLLLAC